MRIIARAKIKTELYERHPEAIKEDLILYRILL